jgi:hypothetical protein
MLGIALLVNYMAGSFVDVADCGPLVAEAQNRTAAVTGTRCMGDDSRLDAPKVGQPHE